MSDMAIRPHGDGKWMIDIRHGRKERYRMVYERGNVTIGMRGYIGHFLNKRGRIID